MKLKLFSRFLFIALFCLFKNAWGQQTVNHGDTTTTINFPGGLQYNWVNSNPAIGLAASGTSTGIPSFTAVNNTEIKQTATIKVTPVIPGFAYVTNAASGTVSVINTITNKAVATIPGFKWPIFALPTKGGSKIYVSDLEAVNIKIINPAANTITDSIPLPITPRELTLSPDSSRLYILHYTSGELTGKVSVVNTADYSIIKTITVGKAPRALAISPDGGKLYVANSFPPSGISSSPDPGSISVISTATNEVIKTFDVAGRPQDIAISPDGGTLYVTSENKGLTFIDASTYVVGRFMSAPQDRILLSHDGKTLYLTDQNSSVKVIDIASRAIVATVPVAALPYGLSESPDGKWIYVANTGSSGSISIINTTTNNSDPQENIPVGNTPASIGNAHPDYQTITYTIAVNPISPTAPIITNTSVTGTNLACLGTASINPDIQQFAVSASNLATALRVTAPPNFEVSLSANSGFGQSIIIPPVSGKIDSTITYVRLAATAPAGYNSQSVVLSSAGAVTVSVPVTGKVSTITGSLPVVNQVPDQIKANGEITDPVTFTGGQTAFTWTNDTPAIGLSANGFGNINSFKAVNKNFGNVPLKATITVTPQAPGGFAYLPAKNKAAVYVLNTSTNAIVDTINLAGTPQAITVSYDSKKVYVANSKNISVIDAITNTISSVLPVKDGISFKKLMLAPSSNKLYGVSQSGGFIEYDLSTNKYTVSSDQQLFDADVSPDGKTSYYTSSYSTDKFGGYICYITTGSLAIGSKPGYFSAAPNENFTLVKTSNDGNRVYMNSTAGLYVFDANLTKLALIPFAGRNNSSMAVTPDGHKVYVANGVFNSVSVIDVVNNVQLKTIPINGSPTSVGVSSDGIYVYVIYNDATGGGGGITIINTANDSVIKTTVGEFANAGNNFTVHPLGCSGAPIKFTITVKATPPSVKIDDMKGTLSCANNTKVQLFQFSGSYLTNNVTVTAPPNFEVSLAEKSGYSSAITITPHSYDGAITDQFVYVRSATGDVHGNIVLSSPEITSLNVPVDGLPSATVNSVSNQTLIAGRGTAPIKFTGNGKIFTWTNNNPSIGLPAFGTGNIASFVAVNKTLDTAKATITVTPQLPGFAYIPNYNQHSVNVLNTITNKYVDTIQVGDFPKTAVTSADGTRVFVLNQTGPTISVINTVNHTKLPDITALPATALGPMAASYEGSRLYVSYENGYRVFNTINNTNTTMQVLPFNAYEVIVDIALSPDEKKLYLLSQTTIRVYNTENNSLIRSVTTNNIGIPFLKVAVSNQGSVYVLSRNSVRNFDSDLINSSEFSVDDYATSIAVTPDGSRRYITNQSNNTVTVIGPGVVNNVKKIQNVYGASGIAISADGSTAYVTDGRIGSSGVAVINTEKDSILQYLSSGATFADKNFTNHGIGCSGPSASFTISVISTGAFLKTNGIPKALTAVYGAPSVQSTSFTVNGANIIGGVLISPTADFDVSEDNVKFAHTLSLSQSEIVTPKTVYVRLTSGLNVGNYTGNIVITAQGVNDITVPIAPSSVTPAPVTISALATHKSFGQTLIDAPNSGSFRATGLLNSDNVYSVSLSYTGGALATDIPGVYTNSIIVKNISAKNFNADNYTITYVPADLTIDAGQAPAIVSNGAVQSLSSTYGVPSSVNSFVLSGAQLRSGILVTPPAGFEVSTNNLNFSPTINIGTTGSATATVYVRLAANAAVGTYSDVITLSSQGAISGNVSITNSEVKAAPLSVAIADVVKAYGNELKSGPGFTAFTVTGLQNSETIGSLTVTYNTGNLPTDAVNTYDNAVVPSAATGGSFKASNYNIQYNKGRVIINKVKLLIKANDKTRGFGQPNPVFDATYTGFKNGENATSLSVPPTFVTPAIISSRLGQYPISPQAAMSQNYDIGYADGILTVEQSALSIIVPNAFSPNGDGQNDTWIIKNIENYPNSTIDIYNRRGERLYSSIGYDVPWDGKSKGNELPYETYYYIINLKNGSKAISGYVTVIR
ncbi:MBG domain-containing protein [Mucilaginibacter sp. Mucisp84]|uniref:MBG domain-containing protein n=1 Tax=Mucilaginibacter sp. Mucisp84 TaxID=3243058 RepID=UPI0039A69082